MKLIEFKSANKYSFAYSFPRKKKKTKTKRNVPGVYHQYQKEAEERIYCA